MGGLSILAAFQRLAPRERVIYFADTAWFPYGPRPAAEVRKRSFAVTQRLLEAGVKMIVVACNTASAAAIRDLREAWDVPFVGMVPGLKPAAARTRSGHVAILATPGTLDGELYARVVEEFGGGAQVTNVAGEGLAELVEQGEAGSAKCRAVLRELLAPAVRAGADTVVLGCTHYHFLMEPILAEFPGLQLVDTAEPVARRAAQLLVEASLEAPHGENGGLDLIVSGDRGRFRSVMARYGFPAPAIPEFARVAP